MSRMVSRGRIAPAAAVVLGLLILGMGVLGMVLDAVRDDLVGVVDQAFQPTQVSIWLTLADRDPLQQGLQLGQEPRPAL